MKKRDLKADLELCNKATPGPWKEQGTSIGIDSIVLYHRTNKKNVDNILKKGLLLSKATSLKCVYLSKHKDTSFGNALFQVTVNNDRYPECYDLSDWEVVCFHDIIPDDLKILEV